MFKTPHKKTDQQGRKDPAFMMTFCSSSCKLWAKKHEKKPWRANMQMTNMISDISDRDMMKL